jgi:hypothetical protein
LDCAFNKGDDVNEALKRALEALEELNSTNSYWWQEVDEETLAKIDPAITAIKAALAQRMWVELTDGEIDAEANSILTSDPVQWWRRLARAVLAKSKEKNT